MYTMAKDQLCSKGRQLYRDTLITFKEKFGNVICTPPPHRVIEYVTYFKFEYCFKAAVQLRLITYHYMGVHYNRDGWSSAIRMTGWISQVGS